ncbi:MAG TPA: RdgB/HAM1 family non-canonical purine NTP pyrophosphatase [Cyclobacteriaceae bacterium]|nr:RdgB/HAM1 family non-canonical purine NTP pyrophosphatase [Cyclobacteriaceae bacterium]
MISEICFATNNKHKLAEVRFILGSDFRILSLGDFNIQEDLPETKDSFEGNSEQKAKYLFTKIKIPCFADDSGLEVESLNGEPGIFSARYAGEHKSDEDNIQLLLRNLKGAKNRNAQFRTVITFIDEHGESHYFEGTIKGAILEEKRGTSGFGYDPLFVPRRQVKTFAEMSPQEKNAMSHRSIAVRKLAAFLMENYR